MEHCNVKANILYFKNINKDAAKIQRCMSKTVSTYFDDVREVSVKMNKIRLHHNACRSSFQKQELKIKFLWRRRCKNQVVYWLEHQPKH